MKRKEPQKAVQEQDEGSGDDNDSISVRIDSAVLDCPVCFELFELPLFQCINGHTICSKCCNEVHTTCPTCSLSISRIRCLPFESIIVSNRISRYSGFGGCKVSCPFSGFGGCKVFCPYEESYLYGPCSFPILSEHNSFEQLRFISYGTSVTVSLQREQPFFILMTVTFGFLLLNSHGPHGICFGNELSVVCIRPSPASFDFQYKLEVDGDMGKKLRLDASPENVRKWTKDYRSKFFLYVPDDFIGSSGVINVTVCIRYLS